MKPLPPTLKLFDVAEDALCDIIDYPISGHHSTVFSATHLLGKQSKSRPVLQY